MGIITHYSETNGVIAVALSGDISFKAKDDLRDMVDLFRHNHVRKGIVDLRDVQSVDSFGLGVLLVLCEAAGDDCEMVMTNPNDRLLTIFHQADFERHYTFEYSVPGPSMGAGLSAHTGFQALDAV